MPGIVALVEAISLDVVRGLVFAGYGLAPLVITSATNTTPIRVTTSTPHLFVKPAHVVIAGVLGNFAANNIDAAPQSSTLGQSLAVIATPVDATTLSLSALDQTVGTETPLVGTGIYLGGGTLTSALVDGRVLLGRQHVFEQSAPPRIVMVPVRTKYTSGSASGNRRNVKSAERRREIAQRDIATETLVFEIHTWGQSTPPDPDYDFDATQVLSHQVIQSVHLLTSGVYELVDGAWADQVATATQLMKAGHEHVFGISFETPVLDVAKPFAPVDVAPFQTTVLQPADISVAAEVSCTG